MTAPQESRGDGAPRPDSSSRPLLAALATAGLGLAAVLLHPSDGLLRSSAAPPVRTFFPVVLLGLGWGLLIHRLFQRHQARYRGAELSPRAERLAGATGRLLVTAGVLIPALLLMLYFSRFQEPPSVTHTVRVPPGRTPPLPADDSALHLPQLLGPLLMSLLLAASLVAGVLVVRQLRGRPHRRRFGTGQDAAAERPDPDEQLAEAVELGRRALTGADARAAVIACYAAMEDSLAVSGVARRIADSPTELLDRAVAAGTVHRSDAGALTALFHEARYSRHPLGEPELSRARAALDAIAAQLAARRSEAVQ